MDPKIKNKVIIRACWLIKDLRTISFGRKPIRGGSPPRDSSKNRILLVWGGVVFFGFMICLMEYILFIFNIIIKKEVVKM